MTTRSVMIVEDNEQDLDLTCLAFDQVNVLNKVIVYRDGEDALDYLFGKTEGAGATTLPALIVLDLNLPGINGVGVLKRIRADRHTSRVPVIVFTSSEKRSDREDCLREGATRYVRKSGNHHKFAASVRKMAADWLGVKVESEGDSGHAD
jgi:two-component system response regulator